MDDLLVPLCHLHPGQSAEVGQLMGLPDMVHRLEELGLRTGAHIEMVQSGSPCIIRLSGSKLCFREADACSVLVRVGDEP
ncbi:MAG TPA: FeoA family protein [Pirellulaceae bacterium]|nr:FeoA family protein [Pirellulaceae bacterium]